MTLISGCGAPAIKPVSGPEASVAYGNITMPEGNITSVMLNKVGEIYAPPFKSPPQSHAYTNGNFFFENLTPGKYYLMGFMSGQDAFYFNYQGIDKQKFLKSITVDVKPGSVVYLGSYRVTGIDRNLFKADTFGIKRSKTPSRHTILKHLIKATKGTGWDARFEKAMK
ncbi:MAG: hypothetical protein LJE57_11000 [Gallionella sp.]|nr:hypothetical protein [Gallionella sp.]